MLKDKIIKINEKKYKVDEHFYSFETEEEILVLKRKVDINHLPKTEEISTIYDLGFNSPEEIYFDPGLLKKAWYTEIIPKTKNNEYVTITHVDRSGLLKSEKIFIQSLDIENPSKIHIFSADTKKKTIIDKNVLITGYILQKMVAEKKQVSQPGKKDKVEKIIEEIFNKNRISEINNSTSTGGEFSTLIEFLEEIFKGN